MQAEFPQLEFERLMSEVDSSAIPLAVLAERAGINKTTLWRARKGHVAPHKITVRALRTAFDEWLAEHA